jgi:STE24 endopeptidase
MRASLAMTLVFAAAVLASLLLKFWLTSRQVRHVARHRNAVPMSFRDSVSLDAHQRAADYTLAKARFGLVGLAFGTAVLLGWTLLGGLGVLNEALREAVLPRWGGMAYQLALLAAFTTIGAVLELPFDLYGTFRIEQRFGFNRMTWKLYLADAAKGVLIGAVIGLPLAALMLWIMAATGAWWWLWAWGAWMAFNLAGFGAAKRVVFFDTLLRKLAPGEVEAVLAHELGHFKHRHVAKRIVTLFALSLVGFALLGWLSGAPWFYAGLGVRPSIDAPNDAVALLLFLLVAPIFGFFISPFMAGASRRHEFEADAYAREHADAKDLAAALLKLHEDNASTLTPDPVFVRFYYSHPPATERLAALAAAAPS